MVGGRKVVGLRDDPCDPPTRAGSGMSPAVRHARGGPGDRAVCEIPLSTRAGRIPSTTACLNDSTTPRVS